MHNTYRAVEATDDHSLRMVERPIPQPGRGQVLIRVQACGVCHTDSLLLMSRVQAPVEPCGDIAFGAHRWHGYCCRYYRGAERLPSRG